MATTKVQSELIVDDVALAGNPTTSTQSAGNNTTRIATTAFVTTAVDNLIASAPGTMDTLNEIAAALGDDPSFTTTVNNAIATKLNLSGGTLTGPLGVTSNTPIITFIESDQSNKQYQIGSFGAAFAIYDQSNAQFRYILDTNGNHIFNEGGNSVDFRVEGDTEQNLFFVDGSGDKIGVGTDGPIAPLTINNNLATTNNPSDIYVKNPSAQYTAGDPGAVHNAAPDGILVTADDSRTDGPNKMGLVLYNDNNTAGAFSPMLLFAKRETGSSAYRSSLAGIYAKAPLGTGNSDAWIDGQLHFATAGAASEGIKSRMIIDKEGNLGVGGSGVSSVTAAGGGLWYDAVNKYLSISHWTSTARPTPAAMLHLSDNSNDLDVPQIRIEGRENPGDTKLDIAVKDAEVRLNLIEGPGGDVSNGYGLFILKTNAVANASNPGRGGFKFEVNSTTPMQITNTGIVTTSLNPAFRANAKDAAVYSSGWQKVLYDQNVTQRGSAFASSRFTAPVDGWYQFNAQWTADNNADVDGTLSLYINGSNSDLAGSSSMSNTGANYDGHVVSGCCYLAATHYVEVYRYANVSTTTRSSDPYGGWFSGFLIG